MASIGPVEFGLGAIGAGLLVAAIRNVSPVDVITRAVGGTDEPPAPIDRPGALTRFGAFGGISPDLPNVNAPGVSDNPPGAGSGPTGPETLVKYTNPITARSRFSGRSFQVQVDVRDGLARWGAAYGQPIVITQGWRSTSTQARRHAQEPNRFAPPGTSWHETGRAVDVDLAAIGADNQLGLRRYLAAGEATGWCFAGRSGNLHASYKGCG